MTEVHIEPRWIGQAAERRFGVLVRPGRAPAGALVFVPPFAEEMNKSRRMVASTARALAAAGWSVLVVDPYGCGDSPGRFEDASWALWRDDVLRAHSWLAQQTGAPTGLWAMRGGALLASAVLPTIGALPVLLLWQPVLAGKAHLTQFLRLKLAAGMLEGRTATHSTAALWAELESGNAVDVAGYRLPAAIALPMASSGFSLTTGVRRAVWLEVGSAEGLSPPAQQALDKWREAGIDASGQTVVGPPFWQTQELEECPALIEATVRSVDRTGETYNAVR